MQYSKITLLDRPMIIDVKEGQIINTFIQTKTIPALEKMKASSKIKNVVYGAVLHNDGCQVIEHQKGASCAYPLTEKYKSLTILDIHTIPTMMSGGLTFTPFAALVESDIELDFTEGGLTAFLRFEEMDIITNVLNRECVYAMKEVEVDKKIANSRNWKCNVNDDRLLQLAISVK